MLSQISRRALGELMREIESQGLKNFSSYTLNRLKNENPAYEFMLEFFAKIAQRELGGLGYENAREIGAICYRALELAERYPDMRMITDGQDVLQTASAPELLHAQNEARADIDRIIAYVRKKK